MKKILSPENSLPAKFYFDKNYVRNLKFRRQEVLFTQSNVDILPSSPTVNRLFTTIFLCDLFALLPVQGV